MKILFVVFVYFVVKKKALRCINSLIDNPENHGLKKSWRKESEPLNVMMKWSPWFTIICIFDFGCYYHEVHEDNEEKNFKPFMTFMVIITHSTKKVIVLETIQKSDIFHVCNWNITEVLLNILYIYFVLSVYGRAIPCV